VGDSTYYVDITIHYGSLGTQLKIYRRKAEDMGDYWQIALPKFQMGEAIIRIRVESRVWLSELYEKESLVIENRERNLLGKLDKEEDQSRNEFVFLTKSHQNRLKRLGITASEMRRLFTALSKRGEGVLQDSLQAIRDRLVSLEPPPDSIDLIMREAENSTRARVNARDDYLNHQHKIKQARLGIEKEREALKDKMEEAVFSDLSDTSKADRTAYIGRVFVEQQYGQYRGRKINRAVKIHYANDKAALRQMPALDPSEFSGVFRVRYVPFPIVGTIKNGKMRLLRPYAKDSPTVFEVGLRVGDIILPGDDFVTPLFSLRRVGIAFAITEKLFKEDAEIIALAVTYDFSSYGSLGVGGNFAHGERHGYASFGINKKAFEAVLRGLTGLF